MSASSLRFDSLSRLDSLLGRIAIAELYLVPFRRCSLLNPELVR